MCRAAQSASLLCWPAPFCVRLPRMLPLHAKQQCTVPTRRFDLLQSPLFSVSTKRGALQPHGSRLCKPSSAALAAGGLRTGLVRQPATVEKGRGLAGQGSQDAWLQKSTAAGP